MRTFTAAEAKNKFGEMVDMARSAPVAITKYDRPVLVVMAVEEFERLQALDGGNEGDLAKDARSGRAK
jgi:prevent-host-death family protein